MPCGLDKKPCRLGTCSEWEGAGLSRAEECSHWEKSSPLRMTPEDIKSITMIPSGEATLQGRCEHDALTAHPLAAKVEKMETFLQNLADDTNPTGPMADAAVHAAIVAHLAENGDGNE